MFSITCARFRSPIRTTDRLTDPAKPIAGGVDAVVLPTVSSKHEPGTKAPLVANHTPAAAVAPGRPAEACS